MYQWARQVDAELSFYLHIPHPEQLSDELWVEKKRQLDYLKESGIIPGYKK